MNTYLFDFDGTLVDSMPAYGGVMKKILDDNRIPYGEDLLKIITPLGLRGTAEYYVKIGLKLSVHEIIARMGKGLYDEYALRIPLKEGVRETLEKMRARGDRLNVLTASPHITLDACLKRLGVFDWFDNVWSCDDFNTTKANPEIYKMAAERLGCRVDEVIFLDDNYNADKTAKEAGMRVIGVYDDTSAEYENEIREVSDAYIRDFGELLKITL